jgi:hypothetical protein
MRVQNMTSGWLTIGELIPSIERLAKASMKIGIEGNGPIWPKPGHPMGAKHN